MAGEDFFGGAMKIVHTPTYALLFGIVRYDGYFLFDNIVVRGLPPPPKNVGRLIYECM